MYNTAVLIDRADNLAGKYRKVYLPREEIEEMMQEVVLPEEEGLEVPTH